MLDANAETIALHTAATTTARTAATTAATPIAAVSKTAATADDPAWQRLRTALDEVSGQRDCHASHLYWYTDLDAAEAAAKRSGKPILSLRLLGKLTDEYSCANSRFFRTTLYANAEIGKVLHDRFILHWKSVRPVPKVTIDFGDGRKLQRTLTGNSIHYILDCNGQTIDALPGLYGPKAFLRELERAEQAAKQAAGMSGPERRAYLMAYHRDRAAAIAAAWRQDLAKLGIHIAATSPAAALAQATTAEAWNRIAQLHAADAQLDAASIALIRAQHPTAAAAARRAFSKSLVEDPLVRMVRTFQGSIAIDTVRNEDLFHLRIHQWLAKNPDPNLAVLNDRVYAKLFLTPSSDPWLGLMPADAYTGLENNGVEPAAK